MELTYKEMQKLDERYAAEVVIALDGAEQFGSVLGRSEFMLVLHDFRGVDGLALQLRCFGDGVRAFSFFLTAGGLRLLQQDYLTPQGLIKALRELGLTEEESD